MALTRQKKEEIVAEIAKLLEASKLTVLAKYTGTSVKAMQSLKRASQESQTVLKVVKNRLVIKAMSGIEKFDAADATHLKSQLLYAFNKDDEVAPAQVLANFAKTEPTLEFVGAFTADGNFMSAEDVQALASLPSKDQLRGQLVGLISSPLSGLVGVLSGNLSGVLSVMTARAETIK